MIIESTGEDFEYHWGFIDYKGKTILDIGADYGSTARCFFEYGALKVYAVEGNVAYYNKLKQSSVNLQKYLIPIIMLIKSSRDFINIFTNIQEKVDIVKIDIEGDELTLIDVPDDILRKYDDYIIETHHTDIRDKIIPRFKAIGYELKLERPLSVTGFHAIWLHKKE